MGINGHRSSPRPPGEGSRRGDYEQYVKPRLGRLLRAVGLDVAYHRGAGDFVYYRDKQDREIEVLDLVGGFGALLLGHSHPRLVAEGQRLLAAGRPFLVQGSLREHAARLGRELSLRAGGQYRVVFANSGAEAVEAAMKHAMLETSARTFLTLEGAFHGKTLGALQLTDNEDYRREFQLSGLDVARVRLNDIDHLEAEFAAAKGLAGFVFEPVLGEGGVCPVDAKFARRAAELCAERDVPLIADECQTGLGRTGHFLASAALGVRPDYVVLAKALGGGLAKIAAVLIREARYRDAFDMQHTSTFAEDDYSCAIARQTLQLIDESIMSRCRRQGDRLLAGLRDLQRRHPAVIADVRGRGLLAGIEFRRLADSPSFTLRLLSSQDDLLYVVSGYLLHAHRIRVAPTLSNRFTLRLQPSALIGDDQLQRLFTALDDVCIRLARGDARGLTEYLLECEGSAGEEPVSLRGERALAAYDEARFRRRQQCVPATRVAWLCHLIDADCLTALEAPFGRLSFETRERYLDRFAPLAGPVVLSAVNVHSRLGGEVRLYPILLPVTSRWIKRQLEMRKRGPLRKLVEQGIDVARRLGCSMVSLGQYTSIATRNGRSLSVPDMGLTTGNSYSIGLAIQAIRHAESVAGRVAADAVLAVAGAGGNIGGTCARMLAPHYGRTILIGSNRPGNGSRLQEFARQLPNTVVADDFSALAAADVVLVAMNSVDVPLGPDHFAPETIVCDISIPSSLQRETWSLRPDLTIIKGGIARLPRDEDLEIVGFPLPRGYTYGCMAEGILLGLEGVRDVSHTGALTAEHVRRVEAMAQRHGFELADYKSFCVLGSERRETPHVATP